jgi:hypothetical protein
MPLCYAGESMDGCSTNVRWRYDSSLMQRKNYGRRRDLDEDIRWHNEWLTSEHFTIKTVSFHARSKNCWYAPLRRGGMLALV